MATSKDKTSRVKVSRRLNESEQERIRHTFLSAGINPVSTVSPHPSLEKENKLVALHNECFYNHSSSLLEAIKSHLASQDGLAEINCQDSIGLSPLHLLCGFNGSPYFIEAMQLLIEQGADVKAVDLRGYTPFHYMCFNAVLAADIQLKGLAILVQHGADINAKEYRVKASPLHLICNYNTSKKLDSIVSFFVLNKASLHARTFENRTALHCLCRTHNNEHLLDVVSILIRHGADVNVRDNQNLTALHEVCFFYQLPNLKEVIDQLLGTKATCINYTSMHKRSALHLIGIHYHLDNLPELLECMIGKHGADPNQGDEKYRTPLHYVLQYNRSSRWVDAVATLIKHESDVDRQDLKEGRNAIFFACLNYYQAAQLPQVISLLIKHKSKVNVIDKRNRSILHYLTSAVATDLDVSQCVQTILPHLTSSTVDVVSVEGTTALTQAARIGCVSTLRQLIPISTKNVTDSFGKNVLDYLKEFNERKVRSICYCCQSLTCYELSQQSMKQLMTKERVRVHQPKDIGLGELGRYVLDVSPYITFLDEDRLVKPSSKEWLEFLDFWRDMKNMNVNSMPRLLRHVRDMTHTCKIASLIPARRNKCGWCDVIGNVYDYVKAVAERAGQMDRRFRPLSVIPHGSLAEGSKLFTPDAHHFTVVLADWHEDPLNPETVVFDGDEAMVEQFSSERKLSEISSTKVSQYYHGLVETASTWVQRFEIFTYWISSFNETYTTLYLVHRPRNGQRPLSLEVTLTMAIERAPNASLVRTELPSWCLVAERHEKMEYLAAKPGLDGWRAIYPALERDSIRYAGSTVLLVFQLVKLLVRATHNVDDSRTLKQEPSSFALKNSLLLYMELNPPPWNTVDIVTHSQGVLDVFLDKHDFSVSFFHAKDKVNVEQLPLFTPVPFEIKKRVTLIKLQLGLFLNDRHHSFTI